MATSTTGSGSASATPNVLYAIGVPKAVTAARLGVTINLCGAVKASTMTELANSLRRTWKLEFENVTRGASILFLHLDQVNNRFPTCAAEMAMATLHETVLPNVLPLHVLRLSTSPDLGALPPPSNVKPPPVSLKSAERHPIHELSAQELFTIFRPAGAIRLIRTNVNVGHSHLVSVIEYQATESIPLARNILRGTLSAKAWPDCNLQTYEPANLYVSVSKQTIICDLYRLKRYFRIYIHL
jgi:hypothetical protein